LTDCAGVRRDFEIDVRHLPNHAHAAAAREVTISDSSDYAFRAFAEASATMAMAGLRIKLRQALAQRFLNKEGPAMELAYERIRGRIDAEGIVVDVQLLNCCSRTKTGSSTCPLRSNLTTGTLSQPPRPRRLPRIAPFPA
jgi:hypothetical protein